MPLQPSSQSTYHAAPEGGSLTYSIDSGCMGTLSVTIDQTTYVYKLSDILGRIEVAV